MRNKFLKMTFMALCLSTSSVVHAVYEDGDEETVHAPILFSGEYEIGGAGFLEAEYGSVTIHQFDNSKLALEVNLNDSPGLRHSRNPNVLQSLLTIGESDFPNNLVALYYHSTSSTPEVTRYCGEKTVNGCKMTFEFKISDTTWRGFGEKGFDLWVRFNEPPVVKTVVVAGTELNFGEDPIQVMPTIQFPLFKKADDQTSAQGPSSSTD